jgi:PhnB protein
MAIKSLSPYVNFNGTATQAISLYEHVLGATRANVVRAGDVPGTNVPPDQMDRVLHGVLMLGGVQLMLSDATPNTFTERSSLHVVLEWTDFAEMTQRFAALAESGSVTVPIQDTFWGAKFGMLTDRFGVSWMFNCPVPGAVVK